MRRRLVFLFLTTALGVCQQASRDLLETRLRLTAGRNPLDCGDVKIRENPHPATDCAVKAFSERKPFIVRYWLQGIDSKVGIGLAGNVSGEVFAVEFDSMGWVSDGLTKRQKLVDGGHNIVERCPTPVLLRTTSFGRLTCFPPDPKAKPSLMSPTWDSW